MYINNVGKYKKSQEVFQPHKDTRPSPLLVDLLAKERVGVHPGLPDFQGHAPGMVQQPMAAAAA